MFKKHAIQLKWVKTEPNNIIETDAPKNAPETQVIEVVKESTKYAILMFAGYKALDTISKIAINSAQAKIK
jgi:hypothetical protein